MCFCCISLVNCKFSCHESNIHNCECHIEHVKKKKKGKKGKKVEKISLLLCKLKLKKSTF